MPTGCSISLFDLNARALRKPQLATSGYKSRADKIKGSRPLYYILGMVQGRHLEPAVLAFMKASRLITFYRQHG
jgi:hypothetical protein